MSIPALHYRILQLAYKHKLSHIGSCLGAVDTLDSIYSRRTPDEPVILSVGHAGLALYAILEKHCGKDAEDLLKRHSTHPHKNADDGIWCSTGSLGQGLSVAVGRAIADRNRRVWCVISDGEMAEGVVYESLNYAARTRLTNLHVYGLCNGWAAYHEISPFEAGIRLVTMCPWATPVIKTVDELGYPFLKGQNAHYKVMKDEDWAWVEENYNTAFIKCPQCDGKGQHYMALHSPPILIGCSRCYGKGVCSP